MSDELNEVRPGDRITADLVNTIIRRVRTPSTGGGGTQIVPPLFGLALPTARQRVVEAQLTVTRVIDAYGREVDPNVPVPQVPVVINQIPAADVRVNAGHGVLIAVSVQIPTAEGPLPPSGPAIPDFMHQSLPSVEQILTSRGFVPSVLDVFGRSVEANDPNRSFRHVIGQFPLPGTLYSAISSVRLVTTEVAGPDMPRVVGYSLLQARNLLTASGILAELRALDAAGRPVDPNDSRFHQRLVIGQIPVPGPQARSITTVDLITTMEVPLPSSTPQIPNLLHLDLAQAKTRIDAVEIPIGWLLVRDVFGQVVDATANQNDNRLVLNQFPPHGTPVISGVDMRMNLVVTGLQPTTPPPGGGGETPTPNSPRIASFFPSSTVPADTEIRIFGENFASNPLLNTVTIGTISVIPSPESTTGTLFVVVPRELWTTGSVVKDVRVTTSAGSDAKPLTITQPSSTELPQIELIEPLQGVIGADFFIRTNIGDFGSNSTRGQYVYFDGIRADYINFDYKIPNAIPDIPPGSSRMLFVKIVYNGRTSPAFSYRVTRPLSQGFQSAETSSASSPDPDSGQPPVPESPKTE